MIRTFLSCLAAVSCALLAACGSTRESSEVETRGLLASEAVPLASRALDAVAPAAAAILEGFDEPTADGAWRVGDRALVGCVLHDGDEATVRLVHLELRSEPIPWDGKFAVVTESRPAGGSATNVLIPRHRSLKFDSVAEEASVASDWVVVAVTVYEGDGTELGRSLVTVPDSALRMGFKAPALRYRKARHIAEMAGLTEEGGGRSWVSGSPDAVAAMINIIRALFGFIEIFEQADELASFREQASDVLVARPSFLSVLFGGVSVSVDPRLEDVAPESRPMPTPAAPASVTFPTLFDVNDQPTFHLVLSAADTAPPYHLTAGVIAIDGMHPTRAERRLLVRLLAARRAAGQ